MSCQKVSAVKRRIPLLAALIAIFVLALLPVRAFAEEVADNPRDLVEPLAAPAEQETVGADDPIDELTISQLNTMLIPNQQPWFDTKLDPSDPNSSLFEIRSEVWIDSTNDDVDAISGPDLDFGYEPRGIAHEGATYDYTLYVHPKDGATLASTVTIHFQGKDYKAQNMGYSDSIPNCLPFYTLRIPLRVKAAYPAPLYRMYNTKTSEHLWTRNKKEYDSCGTGNYRDWKAEGVAWYAPVSSSKPVYRLYNPKSGDHHYTTSLGEKDKLVSSGQWRDEGIAFFSATKRDANTIKIYRVYNSRLKRGQHHYTKSAAERDSLVKNNGWKDEGVGFYGFRS